MKRTIILIACLAFNPKSIWAQQQPVAIEFGMRVGIPLVVPVRTGYTCFFCGGHTFEPAAFAPGAIVGVAGNHWGLRIEGVERRIHFSSHSNVPPVAGYSSSSETHARGWEFPVLVSYQFYPAPARPFAGAGVGYIGTAVGNTDIQTIALPSGVATRDRSPYKLPGSVAYYIDGGLQVSNRHFWIRPELRYTRRKDQINPSNDVVTKPNLWEIVVGFGVGFSEPRIRRRP
jgi:hypothetical protein